MENQNTQPQSTQSEPAPKKKNKKLLLIALLLLLSLIACLAVIFVFVINKDEEPNNVEEDETEEESEDTEEIVEEEVETSIFNNGNELAGKYAFIEDGNVWVYDNGENIQITNDAGDVSADEFGLEGYAINYSMPVISPDGTMVSYQKTSADNIEQKSLFVSDLTTLVKTELATNLDSVYSEIEWTADSNEIYYLNKSAAFPDPVKYQINSVNVNDLIPNQYGTFDYLEGCGGGSPDPSAWVSSAESISSVGGGVHTFDLSSDNNFLVHSTDCSGGGLHIFNLNTLNDTLLAASSFKAKISPDNSEVAVMDDNTITLYSNTGEVLRAFVLDVNPTIMMWDEEGENIYYSSSSFVESLDREDLSVFVDKNMASLWKLDIESGVDTKLVDIDAYSIRPLFVSNNDLLYITVENAINYYDYANGNNTANVPLGYYPKVNLDHLNLSNLVPSLVRDNIKRIFIFAE